MERTTMKKKRVCLPCRMAHSACDGQEPCRRCVAADTPGQCLPAPSRKRGRPAMGLFVDDAKADVSNPFNGLTNFDLTFTQPPSSFFSSSSSSSSFSSSSSSSSDGSSSSSPLQFEPHLQHTSSHQQLRQHFQHQPVPTQATSATAAAAAAVMNDAMGGQAKRQRTPALVDSAEAQAQAQAGRVDGGLVGPLVSLLVEQVGEVKRENASLRELTHQTIHRVRALEDDNRRLHAELLRLRSVVNDLQSLRTNHQPPNSQLQLYLNSAFASPSPSPPSPSSFFNTSSSSSSLLSSSFLSSDLGPLSTRGAGGGWAPNRGGRPTWAGLLGMPEFRSLAKRALPFLDDYAGELAARPCVFDDVFNDIYAVLDMREPADPQELCVNSPIFTYSSPGYCAVTGYEMEELVGKPIQTISRTDKETLFIILVNIFAKPPSPVGDLWTTVQTWQHKNGTPLMLRLRHQLFYNQLWQPKWLVLVTESVLESPHLQPQNDILHTPDEFQRFRTRFPAFFDSLFTTTTVTRTTTARLKAAGSTTNTSLGRSLSASFGVEQWFTAPLPSVGGGETGATIRELDDDSADTPPPPQAVAPAEVTGDYQLGDILSILDSPRAPFSPFSS